MLTAGETVLNNLHVMTHSCTS